MGSGKSKPEKDKVKADKAKAKTEPAVLEQDEVIACFDEADDSDVGFRFIYEKDVELVKDIRMTNGYFDDTIEKTIYDKVNFPETIKSINEIFNSAYQENEQKMLDFFKNKQNITFVGDQLKTFTLTEVKNPLLSKNKHEFTKLIMKQVKNFVMTVKLVKKLNYTTSRDYFITKFEVVGTHKLLETLETFASEIKKNNSVNKYWIEAQDKVDDHIREAYHTFEHNVNTCLKLIMLYYEKANLDYQILSKVENKVNYNILVNNFLHWSITNLEKSNFPVYKLYLSELGRINYQINQKIGKQQLIELIVKHRSESYQFFKELKAIKEEVQNNILNVQTSAGTVLFKPIKEKFNNNFRNLVDETLPSIYNKFAKFKDIIEKSMKDHFDDFFKNMTPPFNVKTMIKLNKSLNERTVPDYIISIMKTILYLQAAVYHKKFNLDHRKYERRTDRIMDLLSMQLNDAQKEEVNYLRDLILPKDQPGSNNYKEVMDSLQSEFDKFIEEYNTNKITREFHIYILFSLFICFSGLELRREGGRLGFKQCEYSSCSRHLLYNLTNRMRNYDFALNNWTLINYMEYNVEDFLEEFTLSKSSKVQNVNQTNALFNLRYNRVNEVVEYLRSELSRLKAYLRFSMDQEKINESVNFKVETVVDQLLSSKEYFFSFKPLFQLEKGTNSRHILIFVSSFLNQAENQEELWKDFIKGDPYTECYSFNWPTMDLFSYNEIKIQMEQEYRDNNTKSDIFHLGVNLLAKEHIQAIKLDKLDMNPPYGNLHYMAMLCGKALAFFIGQLKMFETSAVSLVGFSMGSVVTYYCLKDMYYMRKSNMIYNFISIGSPMSKDELEPEIVKLNMGSYFNIYSMDDKVLKYIASLVPFYKSPCGLMELAYDDALYAAKKIKVYNYDMTALVHCHMDYTKHMAKIIDFVKKSDDYKYINSLLLT